MLHSISHKYFCFERVFCCSKKLLPFSLYLAFSQRIPTETVKNHSAIKSTKTRFSERYDILAYESDELSTKDPFWPRCDCWTTPHRRIIVQLITFHAGRLRFDVSLMTKDKSPVMCSWDKSVDSSQGLGLKKDEKFRNKISYKKLF